MTVQTLLGQRNKPCSPTEICLSVKKQINVKTKILVTDTSALKKLKKLMLG
jgi:hypothetical protein